jgi:hypothetical protein
MDEIIKNYQIRNISDNKNIEWIDKVISNTYSFEYKKFKNMVISLIGVCKVEKIEASLDATGDLQRLKSTLGSLKTKRDKVAHTHIYHGTTPSIYAPSNIIRDFQYVFNGLRAYEKELKRIK